MSKVLELSFTLTNNKTMTISITNPKTNVSDAQINAAMDAIVASGYFSRDGEGIAAKKQARFVERNVTTVDIG